MNFLWLDVETTGLNEKKNDIIQLACIPVINGVPQKPFNEFCQPINWNAVDQEALDIHGITVEQLQTFQTADQMIDKFVQSVLSKIGVQLSPSEKLQVKNRNYAIHRIDITNHLDFRNDAIVDEVLRVGSPPALAVPSSSSSFRSHW